MIHVCARCEVSWWSTIGVDACWSCRTPTPPGLHPQLRAVITAPSPNWQPTRRVVA